MGGKEIEFQGKKKQVAGGGWQERKWPLPEHSQECHKAGVEGQNFFLEGNEILIVLGLEAWEKLFDSAQA